MPGPWQRLSHCPLVWAPRVTGCRVTCVCRLFFPLPRAGPSHFCPTSPVAACDSSGLEQLWLVTPGEARRARKCCQAGKPHAGLAQVSRRNLPATAFGNVAPPSCFCLRSERISGLAAVGPRSQRVRTSPWQASPTGTLGPWKGLCEGDIIAFILSGNGFSTYFYRINPESSRRNCGR